MMESDALNEELPKDQIVHIEWYIVECKTGGARTHLSLSIALIGLLVVDHTCRPMCIDFNTTELVESVITC